MPHFPQKYIGTSKEVVILGNKERMTPLHVNSSLLCGKTTLCRDHPGCLPGVSCVFSESLRCSMWTESVTRPIPVKHQLEAIVKFCRNCIGLCPAHCLRASGQNICSLNNLPNGLLLPSECKLCKVVPSSFGKILFGSSAPECNLMYLRFVFFF